MVDTSNPDGQSVARDRHSNEGLAVPERRQQMNGESIVATIDLEHDLASLTRDADTRRDASTVYGMGSIRRLAEKPDKVIFTGLQRDFGLESS